MYKGDIKLLKMIVRFHDYTNELVSDRPRRDTGHHLVVRVTAVTVIPLE